VNARRERSGARRPRPVTRATRTLLLLIATVATFPAGAAADQSSQPTAPAAGFVTAGKFHTCVVLAAAVRCWGYGGDGALGFGSTSTIGDDETPGSVGPVDLGPGRTAKAISSGSVHTCALLDDGTVRCWGFGGEGRLGYGNTDSVGAGQAPGTIGPVNLGAGRTAKAISAGGAHTCAVLDDGNVLCWGFGFDGRLGYGNMDSIGDDETPGSAGPVNLGVGRTAKAITTGLAHTCALLDDDSVRCWGFGASGRLGYGNVEDVGRTDERRPDRRGPVDFGLGRTAKAIDAGGSHTCAVLDDDSVRCWGAGGGGQLGYGNPNSVGDTATRTPASVGPVDVGPGRTARAISAGGDHTCAVLDDASVRCWGSGVFGQIGYPDTISLGDSQTPGSVGPVDLGPGRTATAVGTGDLHTCALLDDSSVRCWGFGDNGRLGYCNLKSIGDDEPPGPFGPVDLGAGGARCASSGGAGVAPGGSVAAPVPGGMAGGGGTVSEGRPAAPAAPVAPVAPVGSAEAGRMLRLSGCLATASRRGKRQRGRARRSCNARHGRTPGRVTALRAQAVSRTRVVLTFRAPGSDGSRAPAARAYLIKQSGRPIRRERDVRRARALCKGACRFTVTSVGAEIKLTITNLRARSTYYYTVAARDNVSNRLGKRSATIRVRTR
jgi:alpha-tubulin suppressor-like RCC1 family protein